MKPVYFAILLLVFLFLATPSYAAACAEKAYSASCSQCTFDPSGKMNSTCSDSKQNSGVSCLLGAYPIETIEYKMGNCPAIDICKDRLETCKSLYSGGNDKDDCEAGTLTHCFARADNCVALAVKNCTGQPPGDVSDIAPPASWCDGFFFFLGPLFIGVLYYRKK